MLKREEGKEIDVERRRKSDEISRKRIGFSSKKLIKRMGLHGDTLTRTWLDLNSMYIGWDV